MQGKFTDRNTNSYSEYSNRQEAKKQEDKNKLRLGLGATKRWNPMGNAPW